ncbi:MAG: hypothetical protein EA376_03545 [Phycisphaeraceae bacterium]|nr:MAG: hypothetical protein EA376_03545 [Phycisphaeraceae bacterium]
MDAFVSKRVCYLGAEASLVRLIGPSGDVAWSPEQSASADEEADFGTTRLRVGDAAAWVAGQPDGARRIDLVCLGVEESLCSWISAPSPEPQVVAAAVRQREEDWGEAASVVSVQPLFEKDRSPQQSGLSSALAAIRSRGDRTKSRLATPLAVIESRDASARIWLDDLDARGVRIGAVSTLWHAIALVWGEQAPAAASGSDAGQNGHGPPEASVSAVALVNGDGQVTWAWARGRRLLAGGVTSITRPRAIDSSAAQLDERDGQSAATPVQALPSEESCGRLVLDWLTWSAHIGQAPDRIIVVGEGADGLADSLGRLWPSAPSKAIEEPDALGATLKLLAERLDETPVTPADPRSSLVELSLRPGRQHRRLFTLIAIAMALLAVGIAGVGFKARQWQSDLRAETSSLSAETRQAISAAAPQAAGARATTFMIEQLRGVLAETRAAGADLEEPPPPAPILDELVRFSRAIATVEESGARIERFQISRPTSTATIIVQDLGAAESLRNRIISNAERINWIGVISGSSPNVRLTMNGEWRTGQ